MPPNFKRDQQTHVRIEEFEAYAEAYIILSLIPHPPAGCYAGLHIIYYISYIIDYRLILQYFLLFITFQNFPAASPSTVTR